MRFFLVWRVWGRTGKYLFSDTAAETGILSFRKFAKTMPENSNSLRSDSEFFQHNANSRKLSIATPPVDVSENKYFPVLYNGFAGGGKRKGIGYREKDAMYGCAGMEDYRIW